IPVSAVRLSAVLENRSVTLGPSQIHLETGVVSLDGTIDFKDMFPDGFTGPAKGPETIKYDLGARQDTLTLSSLGLSADTLAGNLIVNARLTGKGVIPGDISARMTTDMKATKLTSPYLDAPQDISLRTRTEITGDHLRLTELTLNGPGVSGSGEGRLDMPGFKPESITASGRLRFDIPDLSVPASVFGQAAEGSARAVLTAHGPLLSPEFSLDLETEEIQVRGIRWDALAAGMRLKDRVVHINRMIAEQHKGSLRAEGTISAAPPYDLDLTATLANLDLAHLLPGMDIHGELSGNVSASGNAGQPILASELSVGGAGIQDISLGDLATAIRFSEDVLTLTRAELRQGNNRVSAIGSLRVTDQLMDIRITAPAIDLTSLGFATAAGISEGSLSVDLAAEGPVAAPAIKGKISAADTRLSGAPELAGNVEADFRISGPITDPSQLNAEVRVSRGSLHHQGQPLIRISDARASLAEGRINIPSVPVHVLKQGTLTLSARGGLDGRLTADASGQLPIALVTSFAEGVSRADGDVNVSLTARGNIRAPELAGTLDFAGMTLGLDILEEPIQDITGRIRLSPETVHIDPITGRLAEGRFQLAGQVSLTEGAVQDVAITLDARQLPIDIPQTLSLVLNSRVTLTGTPGRADLSGQVEILEGRYYKDVDLNLVDLATRKTRKIQPDVRGQGPDFLKCISLNINVKRREPLLVDNNLAYLSISPDLTLRGTARSPALAGRAVVDEGTITFQRAVFQVTRGTVDFVNPYKIAPEIDVTAETTIRSWTITLTVSGTPDDLHLAFSSDPSESDADILSLIALGKTTREVGRGEGTGQLVSAGKAAKMVTGPLGEKLQEATGLDEVDISMDDTDGAAGVHVSLGADLSRQLSIAYGVDIRDGETVQKVTTYYKLLEHLLMSGYQDTGGRFGGELKYRMEFR
ncbi:MAG TPA: hypothetical protein DHV36_19620, partial [Desulfobacteraceae bacterium]|nr:hypothetical protein [Desulfobacteraceae bacterium]